MIQHTEHSFLRSAQRGLSDEEIEYVQFYATRFHRAGVIIYYLRTRDLPACDRREEWATQLVGTALVFSRDGSALLTVWRDRRSGLKHIRKKETYLSASMEGSLAEDSIRFSE